MLWVVVLWGLGPLTSFFVEMVLKFDDNDRAEALWLQEQGMKVPEIVDIMNAGRFNKPKVNLRWAQRVLKAKKDLGKKPPKPKNLGDDLRRQPSKKTESSSGISLYLV